MIVYAVVDASLWPTSPLGDSIETFIQLEGAERFIEKVRGDCLRRPCGSTSASSRRAG